MRFRNALLSHLTLTAIENCHYLLISPQPWVIILPALAVYSYIRAAVELYAIFTLHKVPLQLTIVRILFS